MHIGQGVTTLIFSEIILVIVIVILVANILYLHIIYDKQIKEMTTALIAKSLREKNDYEQGFPRDKEADKLPEFTSLDADDETNFDKHIKHILDKGGEDEPEPESEPVTE